MDMLDTCLRRCARPLHPWKWDVQRYLDWMGWVGLVRLRQGPGDCLCLLSSIPVAPSDAKVADGRWLGQPAGHTPCRLSGSQPAASSSIGGFHSRNFGRRGSRLLVDCGMEEAASSRAVSRSLLVRMCHLFARPASFSLCERHDPLTGQETTRFVIVCVKHWFSIDLITSKVDLIAGNMCTWLVMGKSRPGRGTPIGHMQQFMCPLL